MTRVKIIVSPTADNLNNSFFAPEILGYSLMLACIWHNSKSHMLDLASLWPQGNQKSTWNRRKLFILIFGWCLCCTSDCHSWQLHDCEILCKEDGMRNTLGRSLSAAQHDTEWAVTATDQTTSPILGSPVQGRHWYSRVIPAESSPDDPHDRAHGVLRELGLGLFSLQKALAASCCCLKPCNRKV